MEADNDTFHHVYWNGSSLETLGTQDGYTEHVDLSVTHWAGQYVPQAAWPAVCGPSGYDDPGTRGGRRGQGLQRVPR
jgi:hypothetical protein